MAKYIFTLPDIGEGIAEAEIVQWHVALGDMIEEDQPIADMMTDKATVEMESPVTGKIISVAGEEGDVIAIGSILVEIEVAAGEGNTEEDDELDSSNKDQLDSDDTLESIESGIASKSDVKAPINDVKSLNNTGSTLDADSKKMSDDMAADEVQSDAKPKAKVTASAAVRARAKSLGVDLTQVKTAGQHVRHADLDAYLSYGAAEGYGSAQKAAARPDEAIKVIGMRRKIAENMINSKRSIPHFTYVEEVDVTDLELMRADLNDNRGNRPKITMLPLLIVAITKAVPDFPMINATYDDDGGVVTRHGGINLGMATQTDAGLKVPVIHDAHQMNIWQLSNEIKILSESSRDNSIQVNKLQGATLTLTSLGPLGGIATTPVINKPEVAIIGPNKIVERPMIIDGEIQARKLMNISISCDHRVVDGYDAASFVQLLRKYLETPVLLFAD